MTTTVKIELQYDAGWDAYAVEQQEEIDPDGETGVKCFVRTAHHKLEVGVPREFAIWQGKSIVIEEVIREKVKV